MDGNINTAMRHRMNIKEAEEYLNGIPRFSKKTTMENERRILELLGNPEEGQRFVHVAGTNGKGIEMWLRSQGEYVQVIKEGGK